jgi:hypothetical protein
VLGSYLVLLAHHAGAAARAADGRAVAKVGVDADQIRGQAKGSHILYNNLAGALGLVVGAVTARPVQLAGIDNGVVPDRHSALTVVLHDLVKGLLRSSTNNL